MQTNTDAEVPERFSKEIREFKMPKALLVGESAQGSSYIAKRLRERGCRCEFAASYEEALSLLGTHEFCLVLSPTRLRTTNLLPLMDLLEGSTASLFYAHSVERGCWWLPAIRRGHKCFGSYAVRPSEFVAVLDETIAEVRRNGCMNDAKSDACAV
jgi:hypothetical protein